MKKLFTFFLVAVILSAALASSAYAFGGVIIPGKDPISAEEETL